MILSISDKKGGVNFIKRGIKEFQECVSSCGLMDLGFTDPNYVWCNNQAGKRRVWVRLNRALCNDQWRLLLQMYMSLILHELD